MSYRFRLEGELLVLQVGEWKEPGRYETGSGQIVYRDATIADIPVRDPFDRERDAQPPVYCVHSGPVDI